MQTNWTRQGPTTIGTQPVTMMQHRVTDGRMVVSTYGSGVFVAFVNSLDPTTGLKSVQQVDFNIFPNPTSESITLENLTKGEKFAYEIVGMNGQVMLKGQTMNDTQIDVRSLANGIYILKLKDRWQGNNKRFIKQ
jgi:hypothetical protein